MVSEVRKRVTERWSKVEYRSGSLGENGPPNKRPKADIIDLTISDDEGSPEALEAPAAPGTSAALGTSAAPVGNCPFRLMKSELFDRHTSKSRYFTDLGEILGSAELRRSFLFSFQYDLDFLMGHFHPNVEQIVLVAQEGTVLPPTTPQALSQVSKTLLVQFRMPPFTCHHSKMVINVYEDGSCRIFMPSNNFTHAETNYPQQVCWSSPRLPGCTHPPNVPFQRDLVIYLESYSLREIEKCIIPHLQRIDFGPLSDVQFIYSTPSKFHVSGLQLLAAKLSAVDQSPSQTAKDSASTHHYLCQSSSVGNSLSKKIPVNLFTHLMIPVLEGIIPRDSKKLPDTFHLLQEYRSRSVVPYLLYPTVEEIRSSPAGWLCSGWFNFHYNRDTAHYNMLRDQFKVLYKQNNAATSRQRKATPSHSKFYMRSSTSQPSELPFRELNWCVYTSANLSYSAWGKTTIKPRNYEVGVLMTSDDLHCRSFADLVYKTGSTELPQLGTTVAVPWTPELAPYTTADEAFCISKDYRLQDTNGRRFA